MVVTDYFKNIIDRFKQKLSKLITTEYMLGVNKVSLDLGKRPPVKINHDDIKVLTDLSMGLIKDVTDDMNKKIQLIIKQGILDKLSNQEIADNMDSALKGSNPTKFNYKDRLKMIARTERHRALGVGAHNTATKLGAKYKYIEIVDDDRTSEVSKMMYAKYGGPEKAIPIDEIFSVFYKGKEYSGLFPPFMPNDRDAVLYTFERPQPL